MAVQDKTLMQGAANVIHEALEALGSHTPIRLTEHGNAVQVGTSNDCLTIRYADHLWKVTSHTPYLDVNHVYNTMADCARDIALCDQCGVVFEQDKQTEERINAAIMKAIIQW